MSDSNARDFLAYLALATVAVAVGIPSRISAAAGEALQSSGVLLEPGQGLLSIPHLGSMDLPRLIVVVLVLLAIIALCVLTRRRRQDAS